MRTSSSWSQRTLVAVAVLAMPMIVLGLVGANAQLHSQELPWIPSDPSLRLLAYAHDSGLDEPERMVLRSPDEWAAVWRRWEARVWGKTAPPAVDFEAEMVLVAANGSHPNTGRIIVIDSVTESKHEVVVHVRTRASGAGCVVGAAFTQPIVAVAVPARRKPVRFVDRLQVIHCD
jgi:hypothetical protein